MKRFSRVSKLISTVLIGGLLGASLLFLCSCSKSNKENIVTDESTGTSITVAETTKAVLEMDYENFTFTFDGIEYKISSKITLKQMLDNGWEIESLDPSEVLKRTITPGKYINVEFHYSKNKDILLTTTIANNTSSNIVAANGELLQFTFGSFVDLNNKTNKAEYGKENLSFKGGLTIGDTYEKVIALYGDKLESNDYFSVKTGNCPRYCKEVNGYKYTVGFDISERNGLVGFCYAKIPVTAKSK